MKRLMTAIFLDNTLKIKFCAAYKFDLRGTVYACSNYDFGQYGVNHMPNPHINIHSCLGNYQRTINNILKDKNYIGAVEQCIASCKSLNFGDSIVMQEFMDELYGINNRGDSDVFIELPDGTMVNPKDAVKWLKEQEGASNE